MCVTRDYVDVLQETTREQQALVATKLIKLISYCITMTGKWLNGEQ